MKNQTIKCTRQRLQWRSRLICASAAMLLFVLSAQAQTDAILDPIGGHGGGQFIARCSQGEFLTGFELLTGDDVDAIRPLCVAAYGPAEAGPRNPYSSNFGGTGGGKVVQLVCPANAPVITGMYVQAEGVDSVVVNNIHLFCGMVAKTQNLTNKMASCGIRRSSSCQ